MGLLSTLVYDWIVYPILRSVGRPLFTLYFRGRVKRAENIPRRGPAILIANHTSILDGILIHAVTRRPLRIFVAAEWVDWLPLRPLFSSMGVIRVERDRRNPEALESAVEALERGDVVALFPEGGIQSTGRLAHFKNGAARLALRTGAPIVPCAIVGSFDAMPWPKKLPRPRRITIRSGPAIREEAVPASERVLPDVLTALSTKLRRSVQELIARGL